MKRILVAFVLSISYLPNLCSMQTDALSADDYEALLLQKKREVANATFDSKSAFEECHKLTKQRNFENAPDYKAAAARSRAAEAVQNKAQEEYDDLLVTVGRVLCSIEAKYFFADGRCCITGGYIPNRQLEYVGQDEEQRRIALGQNKLEASWYHKAERGQSRKGWKLEKECFVTTGFIPDTWVQARSNFPHHQMQKALGVWAQQTAARRNGDNRELAELRLRQAKQAVEEKGRMAEQANKLYLKKLSKNADQQILSRLKEETERLSGAVQQARDEVERLTAELLKLK